MSINLLYFGRLSAEKGIMKLLLAFLDCGRTDLVLRVCGDGDLAGKVRLCNLPNMHYLGNVEHSKLMAIISTADFALFPHDWPEFYGMAIVEAIDSGVTPIISSEGTPSRIKYVRENSVVLEDNSFRGWCALLGSLSLEQKIKTEDRRMPKRFDYLEKLELICSQ